MGYRHINAVFFRYYILHICSRISNFQFMSGINDTVVYISIDISEKGAFALSVKDDKGIIKHYKLRLNAKGNIYCTGAKTFPSITHLVRHYTCELNRAKGYYVLLGSNIRIID